MLRKDECSGFSTDGERNLIGRRTQSDAKAGLLHQKRHTERLASVKFLTNKTRIKK